MCASFFFCNSFWGKNRDCMLFAICILHTEKKNVREMLILTSKTLFPSLLHRMHVCSIFNCAFEIESPFFQRFCHTCFLLDSCSYFCSAIKQYKQTLDNGISVFEWASFLCMYVCVCRGERDGTLGVWLWITTMESRLWLRGASCGIHQRVPTSLSSRCVNVLLLLLLLVLHWILYEKLLQNLCIKSCCTLTHQ